MRRLRSLPLLLLLLLSSSLLHLPSSHAEVGDYPDEVQKAIYSDLNTQYHCIKFLTLQGPVGCDSHNTLPPQHPISPSPPPALPSPPLPHLSLSPRV